MKRLVQGMSVQEFAEEEIIFGQGDVPKAFYHILTGSVGINVKIEGYTVDDHLDKKAAHRAKLVGSSITTSEGNLRLSSTENQWRPYQKVKDSVK